MPDVPRSLPTWTLPAGLVLAAVVVESLGPLPFARRVGAGAYAASRSMPLAAEHAKIADKAFVSAMKRLHRRCADEGIAVPCPRRAVEVVGAAVVER